MDIAREPHFGDQGDPASGHADAVGLLGGELEMRSFDRAAYFFAELREELCNDIITGKPIPVLGLKEFFADYALGIDEEKSRARHALELAGGFGVQHAVCTDDLGIGVGKQREVDLLPGREVFQDRLAVVTDARDFNSLFLETCFRALQLDQLALAVRSPIG